MSAAKVSTEIRKSQIAEAALDLMLSRGSKQVSIAASAKKVGVVPSNIYRHYPDKDAILDAVIDLVGQHMLANVELVLEESQDALERLRSLLWRHVLLVCGAIPIPRVMFSEDTFASSSPHRQRVHQVFKLHLERIAGIIHKRQKGHSIRKDVAAAQLSVIFLGLVQTAAILWVMSNGQFKSELQVDTAWQLFRKAIQSKTNSPLPQ